MTPQQVRLRIVELRSHLLSARGVLPDEERRILGEIDRLRTRLEELEGDTPRARLRRDLADLARAAGVTSERRPIAPVHEGRIEAPAPQSKASERRKHPRYTLTIPIRFSIAMLPKPELLLESGAKRHSGDAHTDNISRGGLLFRTRVPVPVGSRIELEIPKNEHAIRTETIRVDAEVRHRSQREDASYSVGVRFLAPEDLTPAWMTRLRVTWSSAK